MNDDFSENNEDTRFMIEWMHRHPASLDAKFAGNPPLRQNFPRSGKPGYKRKSLFSEASIGEELDLHGETVDQGIFALEQLLSRAAQARYECVRIIHGTGDTSSPHTLRQEIRRWLDTKGKKFAARWEYEDANEGAVIVWPRLPGS
jgi:DNA-nicking Smr family endonuclease